MIHEKRSLDEMLNFLNHLVAVDRQAVSGLMEARVPCNEALANHESVQVALAPGTKIEDGQFRVGLLGFLNGFFGTFPDGPKEGWGPITADVSACCLGCGLHGETIEKAGWKQGDEYCPACGEEISWEYNRFYRTVSE